VFFDESPADQAVRHDQQLPVGLGSSFPDPFPGKLHPCVKCSPAFSSRWHIVKPKRVDGQGRVRRPSQISEIALAEDGILLGFDSEPRPDALSSLNRTDQVTRKNAGNANGRNALSQPLSLQAPTGRQRRAWNLDHMRGVVRGFGMANDEDGHL